VGRGGWMVGSPLRARGAQLVATALLGTAAAAVVLAGWLMASPHGSSPDDGYHLTSIWCSRGFIDGVCLENPGAPSWDQKAIVPYPVVNVSCFAYEPSVSAACSLDVFSADPDRYQVGTGGNIDGERAQLYYWTMHSFVSDDFPSAMAHIRIANAVLALLMVGGTLAFAPGSIRRAAALTWVIATVPLGLFMLTSLNTTAWGLIGLGTLWANGLSVLRGTQRWRRVGAGILGAIGLIMALGSRTEALGHVLISVLALALLQSVAMPWRARNLSLRGTRPAGSAVKWTGIALGALALTAIVLGVLPAVGLFDGAVSELRQGYAEIVRRGFGNPILVLLLETPQLWTGAFGDQWGLGWADTPMPTITFFGAFGSYVGVIVLGLRGAERQRIAAVVATLTGLTVLTVTSLLFAGLVVGEQLQPRHYMASLFVLSGIALTRPEGARPLSLGRGQRGALITALGVSHAAALHANMTRYVTGLDTFAWRSGPRYLDLNRSIEWWWADTPSPTVVWLLASIAYVILVTVVTGMFREDDATSRSGLSITIPR